MPQRRLHPSKAPAPRFGNLRGSPSRAASPSSASTSRARRSTSTDACRKAKAVTELTGGSNSSFKKNKVDWLKGYAAFESANSIKVGDRTVSAKNILIATGSSVTPLPGVPVDNEAAVIVDSTGALALPKVPEHLVVIGGGVIGLELGSVWLRLGA
jgi:dihydrolipoamide dehydrogenase